MQNGGQVNSAISSSFLPPAGPTITHSAITNDEKPYLDEDRNQLMHVADSTPFNEDGELQSRVEELLDYSKKRGYKRLGGAFRVSMLKEAQALSRRIEAVGMTIIRLQNCERWPESSLLWSLPLDRNIAVHNHQQKHQCHGDGEDLVQHRAIDKGGHTKRRRNDRSKGDGYSKAASVNPVRNQT